MRLHFWLCAACRKYRDQLFLLSRVIRSLGSRLEESRSEKLPESSKKRIKQQLHGHRRH